MSSSKFKGHLSGVLSLAEGSQKSLRQSSSEESIGISDMIMKCENPTVEAGPEAVRKYDGLSLAQGSAGTKARLVQNSRGGW